MVAAAALQSTPASTAPPPAASSASAQAGLPGIADNFNTFLTLLTTQLQNQDPLSPLDTNEFTSQLVQFASVEQQIRSNETLSSLVSLTRLSQNSAVSTYLGRDALIEAPATRAIDGQARFVYHLANATDQTNLRVRNEAGQIVFEGRGLNNAGEHNFTFDVGQSRLGGQDRNGLYSLEVQGLNGAQAVGSTIFARTRITGVDLAAAEPSVVTGIGAVPIANIRRIEEAQP